MEPSMSALTAMSRLMIIVDEAETLDEARIAVIKEVSDYAGIMEEFVTRGIACQECAPANETE